MEQLNQLLEKLAEKLGVAVDVLWSALMRQAIIAGISDLIWIAALSFGTYWVVRYVRLVYSKTISADLYERWDDTAWIPCGIVAIVCAGLWVATIASLPMTIAEFFNPKYWALMQIIGK